MPSASHLSPAEAAIQAFEALTRLRVCVHDLKGSLRSQLDPVRTWHGGPICRQVKSGPFASRCELLEIAELRPVLPELAQTGGRIHQCHAGLIEWVLPLLIDGQAVAVLFAGQRQAENWSPTYIQKPSHIAKPKVEVISQELAEHCLEGLRQLGERLLSLIKSGAHAGPVEQSRRHLILTFIDQQHQQAVRISDLAALLHLSPSRIAHVVREECGQSWTELLINARLKTACALLNNSAYDLVSIAMMSGFGDQSQFQKIFKRRFSISPGRYRRDPETTY